MMRSTAKVATDKAARYLSQLYSHFSLGLPASLDQEGDEGPGGRIQFPYGSCALAADEHELHVSVEAENVIDLTRMEAVIAEHLKQSLFRRPVEVIWRWA